MRFLLFSLSLLCAAMSMAHAGEPPARPQTADVVTAAYRVELRQGNKTPQVQTWYVQREAKRITIIKPGMDDVWQKNEADQISFERVFHADKTVVEYPAGELRTLGITPNWAELGALFDPAKLALLKKGRPHADGATIYRGKLGTESVDISWLDKVAMPRSLTRAQHGKVVQFTLNALPATLPAAWSKQHQDVDNYARIDASDFGDMEYNPVVRKAMHLDVLAGWRTEHDHGHE